ncbi:MAG TPA: peptidylprolyl isomerase [Nitrospiraceae bacterium]|nr:peptidylprolyl isomerase [Nitrospiraceae bacterium]
MLPSTPSTSARHLLGLRGFALAVALLFSETSLASVTDRIIAVVNTELIMLSELKAEVASEERRLQDTYRGAELKRRLQQVEYMGLTRMIERKLQLQTAKTKGVVVADDEVHRAALELKRQGEQIDETDPNDTKNIKEQLLLMRVVDREVRSGVMVTESELQRYYQSHQNRFLIPDEYRISQILILRKARETEEEARERAMSVSSALKQGADFAEMALKHSDGPEATKGGNIGFVRQGELLPQIERALSALEPGQMTDAIQTSDGWHIIKLDEKRLPQFRPFAEVKSEIQTLVFQQKTEDVYQRWLGELKNKAFIEVKF